MFLNDKIMLRGVGCCPQYMGPNTGKGILVGEMVISSKSHINGVVDRNVKIRPILLKTWTKVDFSGHNDENNRNIKDSMTIAS